jgi:hypothetical protein
MKRDSKKRLFEVMGKTNPDFKALKEIVVTQPNVQQKGQPMMGDIKNMQNTTTTSQQTALSRIDTPEEFTQAFQVWFSSLGFNPQNKPIAIGRVTAEITKIMKNLGYR